MKKNRFLITIYVFTFIFAVIGTTFAYFSTSITSDEDASLTASNLGINLSVLPLYIPTSIIPTNNSDIRIAYENECLDIYEKGACYSYTISIENIGNTEEYIGTINFTLNDITNLNYIVLDENGNEYKDTTKILTNEDQSLGNSFILNENESKNFKIIIWLPNLDEVQDDYDSNGNFSASVTYTSSSGSKITGTFIQ